MNIPHRVQTILIGALVATVAALVACGGDNNPSTTPPASGGPPPANPECPPAALAARGGAGPSWKALVPPEERTPPLERAQEMLALHRFAIGRGLILPQVAAAAAEDFGEIALLRDEGDLILKPNALDLSRIDLRFTRNSAGGYDVSKGDLRFQGTGGDRIALADDASTNVSLPFPFTYYGKTYTDVNLNSDGNLTFEEPEFSSSDRNISRFLSGPPRVAPFFSDLDPSAGGTLLVQKSSDSVTFTWCGVPAFQSPNRVVVQVILRAPGAIDFVFGDSTTVPNAVVGVSPGHTADFTPVDLSQAPVSGGKGAVGERFAQDLEVDLVALAKKFYQSHPDRYDELVTWADTRVTRSAFAYYLPAANEVRGIGEDIFDFSRDAGSPGGQLRGFVVMDRLGKYPDDPTVKFLGEDNTLSVLGQEAGHRWLAYLSFRDGGTDSKALLGRDNAHWSFFFNSDASVMEGNQIEDLGGGSFQTVGAVSHYSALDQYAMGLRGPSEVPPFFYVANPKTAATNLSPETAPKVGVKFDGTRRDVTMQQVIDSLGARSPDAARSPKTLRQAFIFLVSGGRDPSTDDIQKIDRIRTQWEDFFARGTDGRGRTVTRLR